MYVSWTSLDSSLGGLYASLGYNHWIYSELSTIPLDKKSDMSTHSLLLQWWAILFFMLFSFSVQKVKSLKSIL